MDYQAFRDTMDPIIPQHIGYWESSFSGDFGKIIDHGWGDRTHLVPEAITNEIITVRSLDPVLWDLSEFSDHRSVLGRYVYPDISKSGGDTLICPDENLIMSVNTSYPVTYQWSKDGLELIGETSATLELINALESQSGHYTCLVSYDVVYGNWGDSLTAVFFPEGPDTVEARLNFDFGEVVIDDVLCHVGISEVASDGVSIYPNPTSGTLNVNVDERFVNSSVSLFDVAGKQVFAGIIKEKVSVIQVSELRAGLYLLRLEKNDTVIHQRVVVY
jgi:hypothetical protein